MDPGRQFLPGGGPKPAGRGAGADRPGGRKALQFKGFRGRAGWPEACGPGRAF
jgi:hypothetical protein